MYRTLAFCEDLRSASYIIRSNLSLQDSYKVDRVMGVSLAQELSSRLPIGAVLCRQHTNGSFSLC